MSVAVWARPEAIRVWLRLSQRATGTPPVVRVIDETRGAWGTGASPDEVDREIEAMREAWNRSWYEG